MTVVGIEGDQVNCAWTDRDGHIGYETLPIDALEPGIRMLNGPPRPIPDDYGVARPIPDDSQLD